MKRSMTSYHKGTYPVEDVLTTCCGSSKRIAKKPPKISLFDVNVDRLKNTRDVLNFVTQTWKRLTNVIIQMLFIDGTDSRMN